MTGETLWLSSNPWLSPNLGDPPLNTALFKSATLQGFCHHHSHGICPQKWAVLIANKCDLAGLINVQCWFNLLPFGGEVCGEVTDSFLMSFSLPNRETEIPSICWCHRGEVVSFSSDLPLVLNQMPALLLLTCGLLHCCLWFFLSTGNAGPADVTLLAVLAWQGSFRLGWGLCGLWSAALKMWWPWSQCFVLQSSFLFPKEASNLSVCSASLFTLSGC